MPGTLGGLANALLSGAGLIMPHFEAVGGSNVLAPGFVGSAFIGAVATLISYGLYGPFSNFAIIRGDQGQSLDGSPSSAQLTLAGLTGAILVGFSGGRWMTAEADKQFSHGTAVATAQAAEKFAATREGERAVRALPPGSPLAVGRADMKSLIQAIQTQTPLRSYQKALSIVNKIDAESSSQEPR